jgi:thiosulfate/3-mercaptopyruvate sulfurtransferase
VLPPVVDAQWLSEHPDAVPADVRWYLDGRSGRAAYGEGHLPGAVFVDLDRRLSGAPSDAGGRHPLPDPEVFAAGMSGLGIGDDDVVVAYDDAGGVIAARLVWMLRVTGHAAALLDGGLTAWTGPRSREEPARAPTSFTPRPWPAGELASIDEAADRGLVVIDARSRERYAGGADAVDPRAGHIPGARSLPCRENLDGDGRLLAAAELRRRFAAAGIEADGGAPSRVVSYCGSGVTACHNLLALEHAGLPRGRLFVGSWSAWSRDPARPAATGDAPG